MALWFDLPLARGRRRNGGLIFLPSSDLVYLLALALNFGLILIYLLLLLILCSFLSLELVADEGSCTQPQRATNCCPSGWMTNRNTD